ncbi:insecticyanin-B-like [Battus philenor]|uniref:insecticyanin-B-like n=1 Tax=Battus philenor TaxID=42288 RepID=UPI0035CFCA50
MFRVLIFAIIGATAATEIGVFEDGPCPPVNMKSDFNFNAFSGKWYEIAKFPNAGEEGSRGLCTTAEYLVNELRGKVKNTHVVDGIKTYIEGDLTLIAPAKIMLTYTFGGQAKNSYLYILDTDYYNYSIGYSCKYFKNTGKRQIFSWILSRTNTIDGYAKSCVDKFLAENSHIINPSYYVYNDHSDQACEARSFRKITQFLSSCPLPWLNY